MRLILFIHILVLLAVQFVLGGVIRQSKTQVKFKGFGEFSTHETVWLQNLKQHKESENAFKAQGMMGQMISKLLFGEKNKGEIVDLEKMKIFELFHDKKQYRVQPIEKINLSEATEQGTEEVTETEEEYPEEESSIKITRQVFKVVPTGKSKTIHQFPAKEYHIFWVTEWVNTETGEKGKDSLFTDVWTTKSTKDFEKALQEEQQFQMKYLEYVGLGGDMETQAILGLNWIQMFQAMSKNAQAIEKMPDSKFTREMKKIEGIPVLVDGQYFATRPGHKKQMKEQEEGNIDITNPGGMFGNFLKKKLKEKAVKKPSKHEPDFSYHTELIELKSENIGENKFQVPSGYSLIE